MKLKVIGWVNSDCIDFPSGDFDYASTAAIIDDIRLNGYEFTGWHHHAYPLCTPVLNDGKIRHCSRETWGALMAEAKGYVGYMDYAIYKFYMAEDPFEEDENIIMPSEERNLEEKEITVEENLNEEFEITPQSVIGYNKGYKKGSNFWMQELETEGNISITIVGSKALRYLATGDTLKIVGKRYLVKDLRIRSKIDKPHLTVDVDTYDYEDLVIVVAVKPL